MGKGLPCIIFSLYKQFYGIENGNLLRVIPNNKLIFDGTDSVPSTKFVKTNSGKTSTFHVIRDGINYYVKEQNDMSITLKPQGPGTVFKVKSIYRSHPFVSIQSAKSGHYITTDENGHLTMQRIKKPNENLRAWFRIERATDVSTDEVDGPQGMHAWIFFTPIFDPNNNGPRCLGAKQSTMTFDALHLVQISEGFDEKIGPIFTRSFSSPFY